MYYKINATRDQFLTSDKAKDGYIKVDLSNPKDVNAKLQLEFWRTGKFSTKLSKAYCDEVAKKQLIDNIEMQIYQVYPEKKQNQDHIKYTLAVTIGDKDTADKLVKRAQWIRASIDNLKKGKEILEWVG